VDEKQLILHFIILCSRIKHIKEKERRKRIKGKNKKVTREFVFFYI
jgi:hypothetical protein